MNWSNRQSLMGLKSGYTHLNCIEARKLDMLTMMKAELWGNLRFMCIFYMPHSVYANRTTHLYTYYIIEFELCYILCLLNTV